MNPPYICLIREPDYEFLTFPRNRMLATAMAYRSSGIIKLAGYDPDDWSISLSARRPVYRNHKNRNGTDMRTNPVVKLLVDIIPELTSMLTQDELTIPPQAFALVRMLLVPEPDREMFMRP